MWLFTQLYSQMVKQPAITIATTTCATNPPFPSVPDGFSRGPLTVDVVSSSSVHSVETNESSSAVSSSHGVIQVLTHSCLASHHVYPADPRQPFSSSSPPTNREVVVVLSIIKDGQSSSQIRTHFDFPC